MARFAVTVPEGVPGTASLLSCEASWTFPDDAGRVRNSKALHFLAADDADFNGPAPATL